VPPIPDYCGASTLSRPAHGRRYPRAGRMPALPEPSPTPTPGPSPWHGKGAIELCSPLPLEGEGGEGYGYPRMMAYSRLSASASQLASMMLGELPTVVHESRPSPVSISTRVIAAVPLAPSTTRTL
jgi:hypothetical protein